MMEDKKLQQDTTVIPPGMRILKMLLGHENDSEVASQLQFLFYRITLECPDFKPFYLAAGERMIERYLELIARGDTVIGASDVRIGKTVAAQIIAGASPSEAKVLYYNAETRKDGDSQGFHLDGIEYMLEKAQEEGYNVVSIIIDESTSIRSGGILSFPDFASSIIEKHGISSIVGIFPLRANQARDELVRMQSQVDVVHLPDVWTLNATIADLKGRLGHEMAGVSDNSVTSSEALAASAIYFLCGGIPFLVDNLSKALLIRLNAQDENDADQQLAHIVSSLLRTLGFESLINQDWDHTHIIEDGVIEHEVRKLWAGLFEAIPHARMAARIANNQLVLTQMVITRIFFGLSGEADDLNSLLSRAEVIASQLSVPLELE